MTQGTADSITIEVTGNTFFSTPYLTRDMGEPKNRADVEALIENILTKYNDAGFPFCQITPHIIYQGALIEEIILDIQEQERVMVADYLFNIKGQTEKAAVRKIAHVKSARYFSARAVERARNRLLRTGVFESINEDIMHRAGNYYLLFNLIEKRSDYVTALGSFAKDDLNVSFSFYSLNLLGTLRQLQFHYEYQKLFLLQYTEPILIAPSVFDFKFSLLTEDSARLTQLAGKFTAPFSDYVNVSLSTGAEIGSYYVNSEEGRRHVDKVLGLGLNIDDRAATLTCQQSFNFEYSLRQFDRWRITYDGLVNFSGFLFKPHYCLVKTDSFEYFDYFRIGGSKNMRGYLEDEFFVAHALWLNIEYRKFFIFPIFDVGMFDDDLKFSYGFSIAAKSDFADAALTLAWPRGGGWRDGKVHLMFEKGL